MNAQSKYAGLKGVALVLLLGALVFGGLGITGAAAQSSLPGDTLYSVKSTIERTRLSFAQDAGRRAELRLGFAELRLQEIEALIAEGRYQEVGEAALAFEADLHGAILELETIARLDPARGSQLALEITAALQRFSQSLIQMAATAPDAVRIDVERALDTAQIATSLDLDAASLPADDDGNSNINGADESNVNGDDDCLAAGLDNTNINGDDDCMTAEDNSNINGEDDCDSGDNSNINGDDCTTADDNSNINGDDDSNTNGDDTLVDSANSNSDDSGGGSGSGGGSDDGGNSGSGGGGSDD